MVAVVAVVAVVVSFVGVVVATFVGVVATFVGVVVATFVVPPPLRLLMTVGACVVVEAAGRLSTAKPTRARRLTCCQGVLRCSLDAFPVP